MADKNLEDLYKSIYEKKADKDYDGDGKVESGSKEHAGAVHNAIQRKKGLKPDGQDTRKEEVEVEEENLDEGLRDAVKGLLGRGKKKEEKKPESRGEQLRKKYNVGPEKSDTSAKRQILDRTRAKKERDQKEYGGSTYSKSVAKKSADAHDRYLRAGYSKYGADDRRGSGNKARKRAAALSKEELEMTGLFLDWEIDAILEVFNEGVRDTDPEKGTEERKERLEKKRGMKLDDHPQYKKEEYELDEEVIDENRRAARSAGGYKDDSKKQTDPSKDGFTGISGSIKEIMRQNKEIEAANKAKTKKEEVEIEEGMKAARDNVGAGKCWDGYKATGTKMKGGKEVPDCKKEETSWASRSKVEFSKPEVVEEQGISGEKLQEVAPALAAALPALKGAAMRVAASQTARMAAKQVGKAAVKGAANKMSQKLNPEQGGVSEENIQEIAPLALGGLALKGGLLAGSAAAAAGALAGGAVKGAKKLVKKATEDEEG